jgi:hypothetical protein
MRGGVSKLERRMVFWGHLNCDVMGRASGGTQ